MNTQNNEENHQNTLEHSQKQRKKQVKTEIKGGYIEKRCVTGKELIEQAFNTTVKD